MYKIYTKICHKWYGKPSHLFCFLKKIWYFPLHLPQEFRNPMTCQSDPHPGLTMWQSGIGLLMTKEQKDMRENGYMYMYG